MLNCIQNHKVNLVRHCDNAVFCILKLKQVNDKAPCYFYLCFLQIVFSVSSEEKKYQFTQLTSDPPHRFKILARLILKNKTHYYSPFLWGLL